MTNYFYDVEGDFDLYLDAQKFSSDLDFAKEVMN